MGNIATLSRLAAVVFVCSVAPAQIIVIPTDIQQPGTQPGQVGNLESPDRCDNCHGGYNLAVEPAHNWRGSMMAQAGRDPVFWATMAVAEQDFPGAGDLCMRCHAVEGWMGGRSTPTDGSGLAASDSSGVSCDACHKSTNPANTEWLGTMVAPFIANNNASPAQGYLGSGMYSLWGGNEKLGPYLETTARHQFGRSLFHRSADFCGTCHDVSNPAVGDLAHNNGAQVPLSAGQFSGVPGSPVAGKAAFKNFPFQYGVVERTFSEYKSSAFPQLRVADYNTLPAELRAGSIQTAYQRAMATGAGGNYSDGAIRYFSCQTCHVPPVTGAGCNKAGTPIRTDLPLHDMTGGNYWTPDAIQYLDGLGRLRLGGGVSAGEVAAMNAGKGRARAQLDGAASLTVSGNTLRVVNLTGHKLISGYPEGRRMWLRVTWRSPAGSVLREDGRYGPLAVNIGGEWTTVDTIVDLADPYTRIYEAHYAMTQEWANQLLSLGYSSSLPLSYDRVTGQPDYTLGQLAAQAPGTYHETFRFVLNNYVAKDNRIPPYGFRYDDARLRSALPVPEDQFGNPGPGGVYRYWDEVNLQPPVGATSASIELLYQPTSWEYIQFLAVANTGQVAFLANEGAYLLDAWRNTGMAAPHVMATTTWTRGACDAPIIATQPASQFLCPSEVFSLSVTASSTYGAMTYQWTKDGMNIQDATEATFTIAAVSAEDVGSYRCVVSNDCDSTTSSPATLSVRDAFDPMCMGCPPCPADYDNNGGVDGGDLAAFFLDFENGEACADVDLNGGVDGGDLAFFFMVFEEGGC